MYIKALKNLFKPAEQISALLPWPYNPEEFAKNLRGQFSISEMKAIIGFISDGFALLENKNTLDSLLIESDKQRIDTTEVCLTRLDDMDLKVIRADSQLLGEGYFAESEKVLPVLLSGSVEERRNFNEDRCKEFETTGTFKQQLLIVAAPSQDSDVDSIEEHPFSENDIIRTVLIQCKTRFSAFFEELLADQDLALEWNMTLFHGKATSLFRADLIECPKPSPQVGHFLMSKILSSIMVSSKPVRKCTSQLFYPFTVEKGSAEGESPLAMSTNLITERCEAPHVTFFSKNIRKKLFRFEEHDKPFISTERLEVNGFISYTDPTTGIFNKLQVRDALLHWTAYYGCGLLELCVDNYVPEESSPRSWEAAGSAETESWWIDLLVQPEAAAVAQLNNIANSVYYTRQNFKEFETQGYAGKICNIELRSTTDHEVISEGEGSHNLLQTIFAPRSFHIENSIDTRLIVNATYALAGPSPSNEIAEINNRITFNTLLDVDRFCDISVNNNNFYADEFLEQQQHRVYLRWAHYGTLYGYTDHSNIYLGYGARIASQLAEEDVIPKYGKMLALNLVYDVVLRKLSDEFDSDVQSGDTRQKILNFTRNHWFHRVTEKLQSKEIFAFQQNGLDLKSSFEVLNSEVEQYEDHEARLRSEQISRVGILLTLLALALSFLALQPYALKNYFQPLYSQFAQFLFPYGGPQGQEIIEGANQLSLIVGFSLVSFFTTKIFGGLDHALQPKTSRLWKIDVRAYIFLSITLSILAFIAHVRCGLGWISPVATAIIFLLGVYMVYNRYRRAQEW